MSTSQRCTTPHGDVLLGSFEEVLSIPGRYFNDHCLVLRNGRLHFFGIVGDAVGAQEPSAGPAESSFAHASCVDLHGPWEVHADVMEANGVWPEASHVYAPYVIEHAGQYYMYYCAPDERGTQRLCLATSGDLFEWQRYGGNPVIVPSVYWSKWPGFGLDTPDDSSFGGCRDAHVIELGDGRFVAYWVSRLQEKFGTNMVCVAASVSHDLVHWQEIGPIFGMKAWHCPLTMEVESPCVVFKDNRYWLFFKHGWWTYFTVSDDPFDFWGCEAIRLGYSHAAEVFQWDNQWWITHCKTDPDDFRQKRSDCSRGLFLGKLDWPQGAHPRLL